MSNADEEKNNETITADAGAATARQIARACRGLSMAFIEGAFLAHEIDPSDTDLDQLAAQLDTALRAVAAEHLPRHRAEPTERAVRPLGAKDSGIRIWPFGSVTRWAQPQV